MHEFAKHAGKTTRTVDNVLLNPLFLYTPTRPNFDLKFVQEGLKTTDVILYKDNATKRVGG